MGNSPAFEFVAEQLERLSEMNQIQARGTVRIALKDAGLSPAAVNTQQMGVVVKQVLKYHLTRRRVEKTEAERICNDLSARLATADLPTPEEIDNLPEAIFNRLDRSVK